MLSGDTHAMFFENGQNHKYKFPIFSAGPLDRWTSCKGESVTFGPFLENNQYGLVEVEQKADKVCFLGSGFEKNERIIIFNTCDPYYLNIQTFQTCPMKRSYKIYIGAAIFLVASLSLFALLKLCQRKTQRLIFEERTV